QLDELPCEPQPDAQAPLRSVGRPTGLAKWLKYLVQHGSRNAGAIVTNAADHVLTFAARVDLDSASMRRVLRRIVEYVRENLREPRRIAIDGQWTVGRRYDQLLTLCVDHRPHCFHGCLDHVAKVYAIAAQ